MGSVSPMLLPNRRPTVPGDIGSFIPKLMDVELVWTFLWTYQSYGYWVMVSGHQMSVAALPAVVNCNQLIGCRPAWFGTLWGLGMALCSVSQYLLVVWTMISMHCGQGLVAVSRGWGQGGFCNLYNSGQISQNCSSYPRFWGLKLSSSFTSPYSYGTIISCPMVSPATLWVRFMWWPQKYMVG